MGVVEEETAQGNEQMFDHQKPQNCHQAQPFLV